MLGVRRLIPAMQTHHLPVGLFVWQNETVALSREKKTTDEQPITDIFIQ